MLVFVSYCRYDEAQTEIRIGKEVVCTTKVVVWEHVCRAEALREISNQLYLQRRLP